MAVVMEGEAPRVAPARAQRPRPGVVEGEALRAAPVGAQRPRPAVVVDGRRS